MFRIDYLGYRFWTEVYGIPQSSSETLTISHQDATITVTCPYAGEETPLENIRIYLFAEAGSYMGKYETTDSQGQATFNLPEMDYKFRADYLRSQFWSDVFNWQNVDLIIAHGRVNIHVTDTGVNVKNATVYLFTESGSYLGKNEKTDASGRVSFTLPEKQFKFRTDYNGAQYWTDAVTPTPNQEITLEMAIDLLTSQLTHHPNPVKMNKKSQKGKPEKIMLASIGSLSGLITQSVVAQTPSKTMYYYINDHLGTPIKIIDENNTIVWAADYMLFGEVDITVDTFENNFRFQGQYYDQESHLHYNYHRYYLPNTGRYMRADPKGIKQGRNHLFSYASNSAILNTDILGLGPTKLDDPIFNIFKPTDFSGKPSNWGVDRYCRSVSKLIGVCADWVAIKGKIIAAVGAVGANPALISAGATLSLTATTVSVGNAVLTVTVCAEVKASTITSIFSASLKGWVGAAISAVDGILTSIEQ